MLIGESGHDTAPDAGPAVRRKVLILTFDPLTEEMPGPAIRSWHLAEQVAREHDVVLVSTVAAERAHPRIDVRGVSSQDVPALAQDADLVVAPVSVAARHPDLVAVGRPLCIDMYIPTHLENLEAQGEPLSPEHRAAVSHQVQVTNDDLQVGDFFLCASERQRLFWLGSLLVLGRINPATCGDDETLRRLIDVVPFGIPERPPRGSGGIRELFPAISAGDPVLVWGGGIYNWLDPGSVVSAIARLRRSHPTIRLVFMGLRHPNPLIPEMRIARQLRAQSDGLGLTGKHVFFNEGWVAYDERDRFLLDADIGVSTHLGHLETRYSFRTRVLDYLWAGLPMVLSEGDTLSEEVAANGLGTVVPASDPDAIADAVERLLASPPSREAVRAYAQRYHWESVVAPLLRYCRRPWRAGDRRERAADRSETG